MKILNHTFRTKREAQKAFREYGSQRIPKHGSSVFRQMQKENSIESEVNTMKKIKNYLDITEAECVDMFAHGRRSTVRCQIARTSRFWNSVRRLQMTGLPARSGARSTEQSTTSSAMCSIARDETLVSSPEIFAVFV